MGLEGDGNGSGSRGSKRDTSRYSVCGGELGGDLGGVQDVGVGILLLREFWSCGILEGYITMNYNYN